MPSYDKSAHAGKGDRLDERYWEVVNRDCEKRIEIVLFEGWCVGFRSLKDEDLVKKWQAAKEKIEWEERVQTVPRAGADEVRDHGRLGRQRVEDIRVVNKALKAYDELTE